MIVQKCLYHSSVL